MKRQQALAKRINSILTWLAILVIKSYQWLISPLLGNRCHFYPSCSHYAIEACEQHGCFKGGLLSIKRILKCHPWHPGGIDLVPKNPASTSSHEQNSLLSTYQPNGSK